MTNNQHHHHNHNNRINNHHLLPSSNSSTITSTRSNSSTITTARSNSTSQACAACRYQRRKCAPDCILAPYFPHDRQRQFQNAHKLFGVSNITKIIRDLDPRQKDEAMQTITYQADIRALDPVGGCLRVIRELHRQIEFYRAELEMVLHQLAFCRTHAQNQNQNQNQNHDQILIEGVDCDPGDMYDHGLDLDLGQITQQQQHDGGHYILGEQNVGPIQEINSWANINMNNSTSEGPICLEVKPPPADINNECEDFKPLLIPAEEERHEFKFEFDEINEPSEETTLYNNDGTGSHKPQSKEEENNNVTFFTKEETSNMVSYQQQHTNEDNDLKGAATLFTLTNCSTY